MIKSFRHKGLRRFFEAGDTSGIDAQCVGKLRRQLAVLHGSSEPNDMNLPGYRLHKLKGDRKGQWAVWVTGNWRMVFDFEGEHAAEIDFVDYH